MILYALSLRSTCSTASNVVEEVAADLSRGTGSVSQDCASPSPKYLVHFIIKTKEQHFLAVI